MNEDIIEMLLRRTKLVLTVMVCFFLDFAVDEARAQFETGNHLFQQCKQEVPEDQKYFAEMYCIGFVIGVADEAMELASISRLSPFICLDDYVTQKQVNDVVIKWLENHPEKRHYSASSLVVSALSEAFPCHK